MRRPPRSTRTYTRFPDSTLFRSGFKVENRHVAEFCRRHGTRFVGFAGVDPHQGEVAIAELVFAVQGLGLRGLNLQCFEHKLPINDRLLYPLYAKRSEEHTSELQSLMRISSAGFCLKQKNRI